jgi:2-phospho-L-lactate guanylyltransferase
MLWSVVVPVKTLATAKSRLRASFPLSPEGFGALVLAMAADTVTAALASPAVGAVLAVADDPAAAAELARFGAQPVPGRPPQGLNAALRFGAARAAAVSPRWGLAVLGADLPALRHGELAEALAAASAVPRSFIADAAGTGTTVLAAAPGVPLRPEFGPGSALAHARSGAAALAGGWPSLRRDVDTAADLAAATVLGLGPATSAVLSASREVADFGA